MTRLAILSAVVWTLLAAALTAQKPEDTHPPAGVVVSQASGARTVVASVRGEILGWAALDAGDGARQLYLLATTEDDPTEHRSLFRVDFEPPRLVALATDLDKAFDRLLAVAGSGSAGPELLLGRPGHVFRVAGLASDTVQLTPVASAPGLDLGADLAVRGAPQAAETLNLPTTGLLQRYGRDNAGGWRLEHRIPLATRASRHGYGLRLSTPPSTLLAQPDGAVLACGPEAVDSHRLRSLLLPATGSSSEADEAWSRLPGAESVQWSWFELIDGRPVLLVTTNSADKLGILERQQLRLFSLYGDRTQAGVGPWLTAKTTSRRWQRVEPFVLDIDGDNDDDLVVAQVDGLGSGKTQLEAFVNTGRRSFEPQTRSTKIERPPAAWHFGTDLTGDGLADFVLFSEGTLEVYPMLPPGSRRLIARKPLWSFAGADIPLAEQSVTLGTGGVAVTDDRPEATGRPEVVDLDGDGRGELILAVNPAWGFGRLRIVFLPPS